MTEGLHAGECLVHELPGCMSRKEVTIKSGENLGNCRVIGKVLSATAGVVGEAGTGNGTLTKANPAVGVGVQAGDYKVRCVEKTADSGLFVVVRPDGTIDGHAVIGTAYDGQVKFSITDGATDFDQTKVFTIPVTLGAEKWRGVDGDSTDGSLIAAGVLITEVDATDGDMPGVAIVRDAVVNENELDWGDLEAGEITTAKAQLAALGITVKEAI